MFVSTRSILTVALLLVSSTALASPQAATGTHRRRARVNRHAVEPRGCVKAPIEVVGDAESASLSLAKCDGTAAPAGLERLSALAGARGAVHLDARLVEELEVVVDHFRSGADSPRVVLVSGYRPRSTGSYHAKGRALDFKMEGVQNEALVAFCKTLPDTGCGYYPNAGFVHLDVREPGSGHVAWTDVSRHGRPPRYVKADEAKAPEAKADQAKATDSKAPEAKSDEAKATDANADETKATDGLPPLPRAKPSDRKRDALARKTKDAKPHAI